jgi:hypothetical protein
MRLVAEHAGNTGIGAQVDEVSMRTLSPAPSPG